jgi:hypothetical protein
MEPPHVEPSKASLIPMRTTSLAEPPSTNEEIRELLEEAQYWKQKYEEQVKVNQKLMQKIVELEEQHNIKKLEEIKTHASLRKPILGDEPKGPRHKSLADAAFMQHSKSNLDLFAWKRSSKDTAPENFYNFDEPDTEENFVSTNDDDDAFAKKRISHDPSSMTSGWKDVLTAVKTKKLEPTNAAPNRKGKIELKIEKAVGLSSNGEVKKINAFVTVRVVESKSIVGTPEKTSRSQPLKTHVFFFDILMSFRYARPRWTLFGLNFWNCPSTTLSKKKSNFLSMKFKKAHLLLCNNQFYPSNSQLTSHIGIGCTQPHWNF